MIKELIVKKFKKKVEKTRNLRNKKLIQGTGDATPDRPEAASCQEEVRKRAGSPIATFCIWRMERSGVA